MGAAVELSVGFMVIEEPLCTSCDLDKLLTLPHLQHACRAFLTADQPEPVESRKTLHVVQGEYAEVSLAEARCRRIALGFLSAPIGGGA